MKTKFKKDEYVKITKVKKIEARYGNKLKSPIVKICQFTHKNEKGYEVYYIYNGKEIKSGGKGIILINEKDIRKLTKKEKAELVPEIL